MYLRAKREVLGNDEVEAHWRPCTCRIEEANLLGRSGPLRPFRAVPAFRSRRRPGSRYRDHRPIVLNLWVSSTSEDMDIFATIRNIGPDGKDVCEVGQRGEPSACVTKGWLRASHRKLDKEKSLPYRPTTPTTRDGGSSRKDRGVPGGDLADEHVFPKGHNCVWM